METTNPFEVLNKRFASIENILLKLTEPKEDLSKKHYSINEAADILGVVALTIRNHIKSGKIKAFKLGSKYFISHKELFDSLSEVKSLKYKRQ